jgi:sensor histidine kinase YesM
MTQPNETLDAQSESLLLLLAEQERIRSNRSAGVKTVLVVLSAQGMVFDTESLRQKILLAYPEAAVFFRTTSGSAVGVSSPDHVDLLIDFTGPGQRQGLFYARKLRSVARVAVGRNAGFFRKSIFDRLYDEKVNRAKLPLDLLTKERFVQKEVLALAGVPLAQMGDVPTDQGKTIGLEISSLRKP